MKLIIDHREKTRVHPIRKAIFQGESKTLTDSVVKQMKVGDYAVKNIIGIEYKKEDFMESVYKKLIYKQLYELAETYEHPYLFLGFNGYYEMLAYFDVDPNVLRGTLTSLVVRQDVKIVWCGDFLTQYIIDIVDKHFDGKTEKKKEEYTKMRNKHQKAYKRHTDVQTEKMYVISRIKNLGQDKALRVLKHFNWSIKAIANADQKQLEEVEGIGKTLSKHIQEVFN